MAAPQTIAIQRFGYTQPSDLTPAVQPATWTWSRRSRMLRVFSGFDAGSGPSGDDFTADILVDGIAVATITCLDGDESSLEDLTPAVLIAEGDLIEFEITDDGGATAPATFGFDYA